MIKDPDEKSDLMAYTAALQEINKSFSLAVKGIEAGRKELGFARRVLDAYDMKARKLIEQGNKIQEGDTSEYLSAREAVVDSLAKLDELAEMDMGGNPRHYVNFN